MKKVYKLLLLFFTTIFLSVSCSIFNSSMESTTAYFEPPSVELQLNRIALGLNMVKTNHVILYDMAISEDAEWIDKLLDENPDFTFEKLTEELKKNDAFYSTALLTGYPDVPFTLTYDLYKRLKAMYEEYPDVYARVESLEDYTEFTDGKLIQVEAKQGKLYKNLEEAVIDLIPEDLQEEIVSAKDEFKEKENDVLIVKGDKGRLEEYVDNDENKNAEDIQEKKEELKAKEVEEKEKEDIAKLAEDKYYTLLETAAIAIESNYDPTKVPLAKKVSKMLEAVDNGAIQSTSLFAIALAKLPSSIGAIKDEMAKLDTAKVTAVGNERFVAFINERERRLINNAIYALPNIAVGTYYAFAQSRLAGKYQVITKAIIKAYEIEQKQKAKVKEAEES